MTDDPMQPPRGRARGWTDEQRAKQSAVMREHWKNHPHPRKGVRVPLEIRQRQSEAQYTRVVTAWCKACELPITGKQAMADGYGEACKRRGLAEGWLAYDDDGKLVERDV